MLIRNTVFKHLVTDAKKNFDAKHTYYLYISAWTKTLVPGTGEGILEFEYLDPKS